MIVRGEFPSSIPARKRHNSPRRAVLLGFAGTLVLLSGCASSPATREPWVYVMSRHFYPSIADCSGVIEAVLQNPESGRGAVVLLCVFALPFALDTAFLPVTIPHDWLLVK